jgi:FkbM family methyltransferase
MDPVIELLAERRGDPRGSRTSWKQAPVLRPLRQVRRTIASATRAQKLRLIEAGARALGVRRVVKRVDAFRGEFELELSSHITQSILFSGFEHSFVSLVEAALRQGGDVVDIGANVGLYTVLCSRLTGARGKVLAVEPAPGPLELLRANVRRNQLDNVIIFQGAVAKSPGEMSLFVPEGNEEYSSLGLVTHPNAPNQGREVTVQTETLDRLVAEHRLVPAFMKVDVEGAEGEVFAGARDVLERVRPTILSELDDRLLAPFGWSKARVLDLLEDHRYRTFDAVSGRELERNGSPFIGEVIAAPAERC